MRTHQYLKAINYLIFTSVEANVSSPGFSMRKKSVLLSPSLGRIGTIATTADIDLASITRKSS